MNLADWALELKFFSFNTTSAFILGTIIGAQKHYNLASLQYTAEHSHKKPTSKKGWYNYHRLKLYKSSLRAFKGVYMGASIGLTRPPACISSEMSSGCVVGVFCACDVALDHWRGVDWWHGGAAGLITALLVIQTRTLFYLAYILFDGH